MHPTAQKQRKTLLLRTYSDPIQKLQFYLHHTKTLYVERTYTCSCPCRTSHTFLLCPKCPQLHNNVFIIIQLSRKLSNENTLQLCRSHKIFQKPKCRQHSIQNGVTEGFLTSQRTHHFTSYMFHQEPAWTCRKTLWKCKQLFPHLLLVEKFHEPSHLPIEWSFA